MRWGNSEQNQGHSTMGPKPSSIQISQKVIAEQGRVFTPSLINFRHWQLGQACFHNCLSHEDFCLFIQGSMSWSSNPEEEDSSCISFPLLSGFTSNFKTKLLSKYSITLPLRWDAIVDDLFFLSGDRICVFQKSVLFVAMNMQAYSMSIFLLWLLL